MWVEQSGGRVGGGWREGRCSKAGVCGKGAAADRTLSVGGGVSERAAVPIAHMPVATGGLFNGTSRSPHGCAYRAPLAVTVARASSAIDLADVGVGALVHVATVERSVAPRELEPITSLDQRGVQGLHLVLQPAREADPQPNLGENKPPTLAELGKNAGGELDQADKSVGGELDQADKSAGIKLDQAE